ncbi:GNAT family N-acetyltransferase [Patescibacteria group bacterium]|nr:GNAT family N-acetyltransferase [Patescibacteria group bacterium]
MKFSEDQRKGLCKIISLSLDQWETYREIRLRGLRDEPQAFSRSLAEEEKYPQEKWLERVANPYNRIALIGSRVVGTASAYISPEEPKTAHIVGFFVVEEVRGQGVGSSLMLVILEQLKSNPLIQRIILDVNKDQVAAVGLYQKFGFMVVGEKIDKLGDGKETQLLDMEIIL